MAREIFKGTQAECQAAINRVNAALGLSGESIDTPTALDAANDIYECVIDGTTQKNSLTSDERNKVLSERDEEMKYLRNAKDYEDFVERFGLDSSFTKTGTISLTPNNPRPREGDLVVWTASASTGTQRTKFLFDRESWAIFSPQSISGNSITVRTPRSGNYNVIVYADGFGGRKETIAIRI